MITRTAKIFFTPNGPTVDLRCDDGGRGRSVVRQPAQLDAAQFRPVHVTSYRQLLDLVAAAGVTFAEEDAAAEATHAEVEAVTRKKDQDAEKARAAKQAEVDAQRVADAAKWQKDMGVKP